MLHYHSRVEVCGSVLEISVALNPTGNTMAVSPEIADLLEGVATLVRLFTDMANSKKLSAGDTAAVRKALADIKDATDNIAPDQVPSVLTADAAAGATELQVDSSAGWGRREAFETGPGTATDPGAVEKGFVDANNPAPSPTTLKLSAPGLVNAHKTGETIG